MIHRALLGSIERFMAVLIEHYAGAIPMWLAQVQARVITVSEKAGTWAQEVQATLLARGLRVEADFSADKLGAKIFFFSSRRRHTRFDCDWSSDVCSSD